jgi:hypothetical protein
MNIYFIKLKASSLLETTVALTIASFIFGLVTVVFVQITNRSVSRSDIKTHELLNMYSINSVDESSLFDGETIQDGYILRRRFNKIDSVSGVIKGEYYIYDGNNLLIEKLEKIISFDADNFSDAN